MTKIKWMLAVTVAGLAMTMWAGSGYSQEGQGGQAPPAGERAGRGGNGGGDSAARAEQWRQRMSDMMRQRMEASEEEWKVLWPMIQKVQTLSMQARGGMGMMGGGRRGGGNANLPAELANNEAMKTSQELRATLENKESSANEIKDKLAAVRAARENARKELAQAQKELSEVLTVRQEAQLVLLGMLE